MLALLDRSWRLSRIETAKLEAEYKIYALRDKLRMAAIEGELPFDKWFRFMDTSFSRMILRLDCVNLWEALAIYWSHKGDRQIDAAWQDFMKARKNNAKLEEIANEYDLTLLRLLTKRHCWFWSDFSDILGFPHYSISGYLGRAGGLC